MGGVEGSFWALHPERRARLFVLMSEKQGTPIQPRRGLPADDFMARLKATQFTKTRG